MDFYNLDMNGYYDSHPTHRLERPLALVGFVNHLTRNVASTLAASTGLPLSLLDELVEHQLGGSAHKMIEEQGLAAWREVEKLELAKVLRARPASILALGEGVLADPDNMNRVLETSELVYLFLPPEEACSRAGQQSANHSASLWAEAGTIEGDDGESLRALHEGRRFNYELAHRKLDVSQRSSLEVANLLREQLQPT
jgi:shikimate kinase